MDKFLLSLDIKLIFKVYLWSTSEAMADREKKGGDGNTKAEYLENEKRFLDEIKNIFHSFRRPIIWWKIKNW